MKSVRLRRMLCLLTACLLLNGCAAPDTPAITPILPLPAADDPHTAPIGDAGLSYRATVPLYLPSADGQHLLITYEELTFTYSLHPAETILRALLSHPGGDRMSPACGAEVVPAGSDPVEVAGGVATVNLSAAARELSPEALHTLCRAIAATLCELPDVDYVNVLIAGIPAALDEGGWLPLGALTSTPGQELPVLWEQLLARRVPEDTLPTTVPLTTTATLYFPLADASGVSAEPRRITFQGQHPQQLVLGLLEALAAGPDILHTAADLPDLSHLMSAAPEVMTLPDGSLRVTLHFTGDLRSWLSSTGADPACAFAGVVLTLTTFVPSLSEVCLLTGDRAVTSVVCPAQGSRLFPGGLHTRADYSGYLLAQGTVYAAADHLLTPQTVSLPYRSIRSPRALLLSLPAAGQPGAVLPAILTDADVLGLTVAGDALLINLSARYADVLRAAPEQQRLAAYAMVNTVCQGLGIRRVRFYFDSAAVDTLDGDVLWSGDFLFAPGLIR